MTGDMDERSSSQSRQSSRAQILSDCHWPGLMVRELRSHWGQGKLYRPLTSSDLVRIDRGDTPVSGQVLHLPASTVPKHTCQPCVKPSPMPLDNGHIGCCCKLMDDRAGPPPLLEQTAAPKNLMTVSCTILATSHSACARAEGQSRLSIVPEAVPLPAGWKEWDDVGPAAGTTRA